MSTNEQTKHQLWIREQQKEFPDGKSSNEDAYCGNCHCAGNTECGHLPLNEDCSLDRNELCPCCNVESTPMNDADYDEHMGQGRLI